MKALVYKDLVEFSAVTFDNARDPSHLEWHRRNFSVSIAEPQFSWHIAIIET